MLSRLKSVVKRALGRETPPPPAPPSRPAPPPAAASPRPPAPTNGAASAPKAEAPKPPAPTPPPAAKVEPPKAEPVKAEAPKAEPVKAEAPKAEPVKAAKGTKKDGKTEPKAEPAKAEAPKAEPAKAEAPKAEAPKAEPAKAEPKKLSLAERAAAAARAPAPVPAHAAHHDDEDDHHDEPVAKKVAAAAKADTKAAPKHLHADTGSTDKESYILRAKANGRDVSLIMGDEGLNTAPDGTKFWGPLLNESSKAKAAGKVLTIDQNECISCGTCVEQTEHVFYLPADGKAAPIAQDGPMDLIEDAIEACPVTCIQWLEKEEAEEKGYATGMGDEA